MHYFIPGNIQAMVSVTDPLDSNSNKQGYDTKQVSK